MVSKLLNIKHYKNRFKFINIFNLYLCTKTLFNSFFFKKKYNYILYLFFNLFTHYTKIANFCILSYRRRGVLNFFKLTRMMIKQYALNKQLVGVIKASW